MSPSPFRRSFTPSQKIVSRAFSVLKLRIHGLFAEFDVSYPFCDHLRNFFLNHYTFVLRRNTKDMLAPCWDEKPTQFKTRRRNDTCEEDSRGFWSGAALNRQNHRSGDGATDWGGGMGVVVPCVAIGGCNRRDRTTARREFRSPQHRVSAHRFALATAVRIVSSRWRV